MKMNFKLGDAAAPFAHLLGLGRRVESTHAEPDEKTGATVAIVATSPAAAAIIAAGKRAQEDDERETDNGEEVEEDENEEEEEEEEEENNGSARKGKRKSKGKAKRAKAEEDDKDKDAGVDGEEDDKDEEMRGNSALAQARRRERARCESIFATKAAMERPDVAAQVAFRTTMPRTEAIAVLTATAAGQSVRPMRLADRMAEVKAPHIGPEAEGNAPAHLTPVAAAIIAAGERARGL